MSLQMKEVISKIIIAILVLLSLAIQLFAQQKTLDEFNTTDGWQIFASEGVEIKITTVKGWKGKCLRLDYNFTKGSGYGGIQKALPIDYPENYQFNFYLKAQSPNNNLEFKLLSANNENVWWYNNRNYEFPDQWTKYVIKKRKIEFAWGPTADKTLRQTEKLEFTIASYNGGKGTIYLDELKFEPLPELLSAPLQPLFTATSAAKNSDVRFLSDKNYETIWRSNSKEKQEIILDLQGRKEYGGLKIIWDEKQFARKFNLQISDDGKTWEKVYNVDKENPNTNYIRLPEFESAFIKLQLEKSFRGKGYGIKEIEIKDGEYSADINRFFVNTAKDNTRGLYPRYFNEEKSYWTVVGVSEDVKEALINEDGAVEVDKQNFLLEPFLYYDGKLTTWSSQQNIQRLEKNYLPVPSVKWLGDIQLEVKAFASGEANKSSVLYLSYTLKNISKETKEGNLFVALRPFQVNPYYQWLNVTGGAAKIRSIRLEQNKISVNGDKYIVPISKPDGFGAASFDDGDVTSFLSEDKLPPKKNVVDKVGYASGAIKFSFDLKPQEEKTFHVAVPFYKEIPRALKSGGAQFVNQKLEETKKFWNEKVTHIKFHLPSSADKIVNTIRTNLANILINRDKAGIQPGSRSYERSWIRDGSLTSSALLKNGIVKEVREFADWYSANQFENGKVPCVVDRRGPDPVPENDSHGELIYLIKQFFNYSKDTTWLRSKFENVKRTVDYIKFLVDQRSTDFYKNGNDSIRSCYGILPESISHEGYSDKPRHSYWDNFFGMKGLKDAVEIADLLGEKEESKRFAGIRDEFKKNLYESIRLATTRKKINYIPGCAELGDFDATSTTIALYPCNELNNLPHDFLQNTFDKYFENTQNRSKPETNWEAYTPYEVRTIGSFIFLDQPERAHWLLEYFLNDQRPQGWNHWAEVVWKDRRIPRFIGDMPHTWVGSDFINSMRTMFIYENEYDSTVVLGAGLYQDWIDAPNGMSIEHLPSYYGDVSYFVKKENDKYKVDVVLHENENVKVVLKNFNQKKMPKKILANGIELKNFTGNSIPFFVGKTQVNLEIFY